MAKDGMEPSGLQFCDQGYHADAEKISRVVGVLMMPMPDLDPFAGIAKGGDMDGYHDRPDRY
jgi:hypothetical protein